MARAADGCQTVPEEHMEIVVPTQSKSKEIRQGS